MSSSREFNMDQLIRIVQKTNIRTEALFESDLKTQRSKDGLSGYQATFDEYVSSVKGGMEENSMAAFTLKLTSLQLLNCGMKFEV